MEITVLRSQVVDQFNSLIVDVRSKLQDGISGLAEMVEIVGFVSTGLVKIVSALKQASGEEKKLLASSLLLEVYDTYIDPAWDSPGPDYIANTIVHYMVPGFVEFAYQATKPLLNK